MTRCFKTIALTIALVAISAVAVLADPIIGTYRSTDLGGALLTGRASQSWQAPANAASGVGDVYHSESFNGSTLGTQWAFACGLQTSPQSVIDLRSAGTGVVFFSNTFGPGSFYMNNGPWCSTASCTGTTASTMEQVTLQYVNNVPVASVVNINTNGHFDGSNCNLTFAIANGVGQGDTDSAPFPVGLYPSLLDPACNPTRVFGSWGDIITITARIDCPVPVKQSTWGALKTQYR